MRECGRRTFLRTLAAGASLGACSNRPRTAVLTFDDAPKSHRTFVAPLLQELGFAATFFVTHRWMDDTARFMTWEEIAEIHAMGFEIGNHSWSHANFASPKNAARLAGELALVENELAKAGVPKPESFAWCGDGFGPEGLQILRELGYRRARRGMQPEVEYGTLGVGPAYDPARHDPLLIPTAGDAYPDWSREHFRRVLERASEGIVVLQFHGVPDEAHPWVTTPPERFREYMEELVAQGFRVLAMRDLDGPSGAPEDPLATGRYPGGQAEDLPVENAQTRENLAFWTGVMLRHRFTPEEAAGRAMLDGKERAGYEERFERPAVRGVANGNVEVWPYPGGRHPRIGFLEGAIDPLRGTKASVFLPWQRDAYVVADLPELITSNLGHLFLAHTHVPTIWNERNVWIDNVDWVRRDDGSLHLDWRLPNGVSFGSAVVPERDGVRMELWLHNGLDEPLTGLRTQICIMLKAAPDFNAQTVKNKVFEAPLAAVRSEHGGRWILTAWERTGRSWGNERCPCFHADPVLPDCAPGQTVRLKGRLWFYEGESIDGEIAKARRLFLTA